LTLLFDLRLFADQAFRLLFDLPGELHWELPFFDTRHLPS
jgi:hypothetical protein